MFWINDGLICIWHISEILKSTVNICWRFFTVSSLMLQSNCKSTDDQQTVAKLKLKASDLNPLGG